MTRRIRSSPLRDINAVLANNDRKLLALPGVVGVCVGLLGDGKSPCLKVMLAREDRSLHNKIPHTLEGYPVITEVTGEIRPLRTLPDKFLAAMIAILPLPGAPRYASEDERILAQALADLDHYRGAGADAIVLENSHDLPYIKPPLPGAAIKLMERIAREVRAHFTGPIGIQMLEAANETALEIAHACDLDFVRVEGYVFAHVGGAGLIEGCAGHLLRKRKALGCEHIKIFADVKKKHCSHALTGDLDITDEVKQAEFFLVDGVIVTGARTTEPPSKAELRRVKKHTHVPVLIGSGLTPDNIKGYLPLADGFIVGSTFREGGQFLGKLDHKRLDQFMRAFRFNGGG
jgi:membrane complex biogenesis BtpA family protein